jgi:hypothetical protein
MYGHSHQIQRYKWIWIRKGVLSEDLVGFPASSAEIHRFGGSARSIARVSERKVDSRSFLQVAMEGNQRGGGGEGFKRPYPQQGMNFGYNNNQRNVYRNRGSFQGGGSGGARGGGGVSSTGGGGGGTAMGGGGAGSNQDGAKICELSEVELRARLDKIMKAKAVANQGGMLVKS